MKVLGAVILVVLGLAGCSSGGAKATSSSSTTGTTTISPPPPPANRSSLETASEGLAVELNVLLDQTGAGSGESKTFTPSPESLARVLVEWACAPGGTVEAAVVDASGGDISGSLENGFDGPIPVDEPPAHIAWKVSGSCSWHVRVLDQ